MKNTLIARKALSQVVVSVSAKSACTGGLEDVHMVVAMMISGQRMSRITKLIQDFHRGYSGLTGINRENRHTGAVVVYSIRHTIVRLS